MVMEEGTENVVGWGGVVEAFKQSKTKYRETSARWDLALEV